MKKLILIISLLVASSTSFATDFQTWIPINLNVKFNEHLRGFLEVQPRLGENSSHLKTLVVRPALGYAFNDNWTAWVGYLAQATDSTLNDDNYSVENRVWQGITYKTKLNDKADIIEVRNRFEERFISQQSDVSLRWRTRIRGEHIFGDSAFSIIASEELFANVNETKGIQSGLDQNRAYIGVGYRFSPEVQLELGYLQQHVFGHIGKHDANNNVLASNINLNF